MIKKVGDKVIKARGGNCNSALLNGTYTILLDGDGRPGIGSDSDNLCHCLGDWELVKNVNQNDNMNLKEKFVTLFISEPEKSFRKVGITNGDGILTEDGQKVFLGWLLKQNGAAFKTEVVDPMIAEEKDESK